MSPVTYEYNISNVLCIDSVILMFEKSMSGQPGSSACGIYLAEAIVGIFTRANFTVLIINS